MNSKTFNLEQVKTLFRDPTFIPFLMIWITHGIGGWGITFVLPTVIYELGISNTAISQVMTMASLISSCGSIQMLTAAATLYTRIRDPLNHRVLYPHGASEPVDCGPRC